MPSRASARRGARSRSPTAASTCCTSVTSATCRRPPTEGDRLVVAVNDDALGGGAQGARPAHHPRRRSRRAGRRPSRRRLRRRLQRADGRTAARGSCSRTCTARAPTTRSTPCPSAPSFAPTAAARPSSATRKSIPPGRSWHGSRVADARTRQPSPHRQARRAWRHRACDSRRGGAAPRVSGRPHRLARQREASRDPRSRAGDRSAAGHQRSRRAAGGGAGILAAIRELRRGQYDVALDLQGLVKSAVFARSFGRRARDGLCVALPPRAAGAAVLHRGARSGRRRHVPSGRDARRVDESRDCSQPLGIHVGAPEFPIDHVESDVARDVAARTGRAVRAC